jgi:hypothetical protein
VGKHIHELEVEYLRGFAVNKQVLEGLGIWSYGIMYNVISCYAKRISFCLVEFDWRDPWMQS